MNNNNDNISLDRLAIGKNAKVKSLNFENNVLRRHILDMGLTPNVEVTMVKTAPLGDPLQIKLRGYELTLRKHDAKKIFLYDIQDEVPEEKKKKKFEMIEHSQKGEAFLYKKSVVKNSKSKLSFALIGNQNAGKTTLFNKLTGSNQHVGNFPGVTVDKKDGSLISNTNITITDLPGIYSLSPYSNEEIVTRNFLLDENVDGIINIIDATNIERSLLLTTQLMELNMPMVIALNMMDEVAKNNGIININAIEKILGVPIVPISASNNLGIDELIEHAINVVRYVEKPNQLDFCDNEDEKDGAVHRCIHSVMHLIEDHAKETNLPIRFAGTKLVEKDPFITKDLRLDKNEIDACQQIIKRMEDETTLDSESLVSSMRFSFIEKICKDNVYKREEESQETKFSLKIDKILTGKYSAFLAFFFIMAVIFYITFGPVGNFLMEFIDGEISSFSSFVDNALTSYGLNPIFKSLIVDGIFAGVGSVLSFLPYIVILFFFLSLLEDSGYMARVAFFMDKILRKMGLSGRSFVPMLIGFGCSVPAILSARTLPSGRDRKMTIFLIPFMSCTAKLPIYALFTVAFFEHYRVLVICSLYFIGIFVGVLMAFLMKKFFKGKPVPFVMELPNYRMPDPSTVYRLIYTKSKNFITKAFTIIFFASIIVWFLQTFDIRLNVALSPKDSLLAMIGNILTPIFTPLGINDWRIATSFITGLIAKESVVSTLTVLLGGDVSSLPQIFSHLTAFVFLVFALLYTPCVATIATVKKELGTFYAGALVLMQCSIAWIVAFIVNIVGNIILR